MRFHLGMRRTDNHLPRALQFCIISARIRYIESCLPFGTRPGILARPACHRKAVTRPETCIVDPGRCHSAATEGPKGKHTTDRAGSKRGQSRGSAARTLQANFHGQGSDLAQLNAYALALWPDSGKYRTAKIRIATFKNQRIPPTPLYSFIRTYVRFSSTLIIGLIAIRPLTPL